MSNMSIGVGWFGIPGGPDYKSTKTHVVVSPGKLLCGSRLGKNMEFQWCSGVDGYVPKCEHCKKILEKNCENSIRKW